MFFYDGTFLLNWKWEIVGDLAECFSESFKLDEGPKKSAKELKKLWLNRRLFLSWLHGQGKNGLRFH